METPYGVSLQVGKALNVVETFAKSFGQVLFESAEKKSQWFHDLCVIHAARNLASVTVEIIGHDSVVHAYFTYEFAPDGNGDGRVIDSARGAECNAALPRGFVKAHRLLITLHDTSHQGLYAKDLQIPWSDAKELRKAQGSEFTSDHVQAVSGGFNRGRVFFSNIARHRGRVMRVDTNFVLAKDESLPRPVFLHRRYFLSGWKPRRGDWLTYSPVSGRFGRQQGRAIRAEE